MPHVLEASLISVGQYHGWRDLDALYAIGTAEEFVANLQMKRHCCARPDRPPRDTGRSWVRTIAKPRHTCLGFARSRQIDGDGRR